MNSRLTENRKFSDFTNSYIPEIFLHLNSKRSSWLALWTNTNELGRPAYQTAGFSPAYLPSWIIAQLTQNPWQFITILSLSTCFITGLFVILFCRETGLHPLAGLITGISLATSPFFMYWLTFPMFSAVWCWAMGSLLGVTRLAKKTDLPGWLLLAFSSYSLLMTAYPQPVVYNAYILGGFFLYLAFQKFQTAPINAYLFSGQVISAVFVGTTLALPVYLDLANIAAESGRLTPDLSFFTAVLPQIKSAFDAVVFLVLSTVPELFGNPVEPGYPFPLNGFSATPLAVFFVILGLHNIKQTWGWWLAVIVLCMFTFIQPVFELGVKYLGFNLSRSSPLGSVTVPLTVIMTYGVDALIKRNRPRELSFLIRAAVAILFILLFAAIGMGFLYVIPIRWHMMAVMLLLSGLLAAQYYRTRACVLLAAQLIVLVMISYPLILRQNPADIATTSPLVESVRANLPSGSRFAVAAPGISALPPNLNAELNLASIHSYNSLSSRRYHTLIKSLGGTVRTYGRWNSEISPDYNDAMFWMSNIGLMLSSFKLEHENLEFLKKESNVYMHKVISRMGDSLQVTYPHQNIDQSSVQLDDPRLLPTYPSVKLIEQGDLMEFTVTSAARSILVLSQKYHRDWNAQIFLGSEWIQGKTVEVNGVFQGVLLPPDSHRVRLQFKPYAHHAWFAHIFWLYMLVLVGFSVWTRKIASSVTGGSDNERKADPI